MTEQAPPSELIERLQRLRDIQAEDLNMPPEETTFGQVLALVEHLQERVAEVEKALRRLERVHDEWAAKTESASDGESALIGEIADALATLSKEGS